jgi:hypothetical protein
LSNSNELQALTRRYLKELSSERVDYVDKVEGRKLVGMQNIPLVYGDSMLGSKTWNECRPGLQEGWHAEQQNAHGIGGWPTASVVEDESMYDEEWSGF